MGYWDVIVPETRTNYVLNPVAGTTGNYTAVGSGVINLYNVSGYAYSGYKYYAITTTADNTGVYFTLSALTNAIHYMTLRIHTGSDITPMFDCSLDNSTFTTPTLLGQEGNFYVYGIQFPAAQANASTKLYVQQNGAGNNTVYIGHVQVELGEYPTTPITGDIKGFTDGGYYWNGTPHASASVRTAQERSGGRVRDLEDDYDFRVLYGVGTGMHPIQHNTQGMALLPGALFQGYKVLPRVMDLVSGTMATTYTSVAAARKAFLNAVKPDLSTPAQPVVFIYSGTNSSKPVKIYGYYDSGMEMNLNGGVVDKPDARFICYDPFVYEVHTESTALTTSASVADADYMVRKVDGTWYNVSTDFAASVRALARGHDGCIYIGGAFTNVGDVNGDYIVKWNPFTSAISSLSTGTNNIVFSVKTAPNGNIYLGGTFTDLGGANGDRVAYWDGAAFNALSTGIGSDSVYALCFDQSGNLYVGGTFTNVTDANGDYITKWNGTAFSSLGTGMDAAVNDIALHPDGSIYAVGNFTTAGGTTVNGVAKWDGSTWSALGSGLTPAVGTIGTCIAIDKVGNVYVGGDFTAADGVACNYIAKWNGKTFEPLGSGFDAICYNLFFDDNGLLYASGEFTTAGGISTADRLAVWNGTTWAHVDINLPGSPLVYAILPVNNDLYIGYDTAGTATSSYLNTVTNNGSASAYPVININRSGGTTAVVEWIKNETTGETLWCNYSLLNGETLTIDLTPSNRSITSSFFGDVWRAVLKSSDLASFHLQPGTNKISVFVNPTGSPTVTAWMVWDITHWGADMVAA